MKLDDVILLAQRGFTAQQIGAMMALNSTPQPVTQPQVQPVVQPHAQPVEQPQEYRPFQPFQQAQPISPTPQAMPTQPVQQAPNNDPIMAEIQKLTQAMQNQAIVNSNLPMPQSADDILAQIINPKEVTNGK